MEMNDIDSNSSGFFCNGTIPDQCLHLFKWWLCDEHESNINWTKANEVIQGVTRLMKLKFFKITKPLIYIHRYTTLAALLQPLFKAM